LQDTKEPFMVKTDYKNLTSFLIIKELNRRQVKWAEMLTEYHFKIEHVKGSDNAKADALSRKEKLYKKKVIKCQEHCLKRTMTGRLGTIICSCQEHIKH